MKKVAFTCAIVFLGLLIQWPFDVQMRVEATFLQGPAPTKLGMVKRDLTYCTADNVALKMDVYYPSKADGPLPAAGVPTALGPVEGTIGGRASANAERVTICAPLQPVSLVAIHGLLDESVNYEGGHGARTLGTREDRPSPSLSATEALWAFFDRHTTPGSPR